MAEDYPPPAWYDGHPSDWMLVAPAAGQRLYRLIGDSKPKLRDFQSWHDRSSASGKEMPYPDDPFVENSSVSMFEAAEFAVRLAVRFPARVAQLDLARDNGFSLARTDINIDGHYSVWGDPERLLEFVVGDVRVFEAPASW